MRRASPWSPQKGLDLARGSIASFRFGRIFADAPAGTKSSAVAIFRANDGDIRSSAGRSRRRPHVSRHVSRRDLPGDSSGSERPQVPFQRGGAGNTMPRQRQQGTARSEADMTVRAGREFLAVPGPTNIPDEVLQAMHRPAVEIYSEPLIALTDGLLRDLGKVFATATRPYIYIANGHGAWEAALTNVLSRGDKILVLESGRFATTWGDMAAKLGVSVEVLKGDWRRAVRPAEVEARLRQDAKTAGKNRFKAVLVVQIDTASGVVNDIAAIGKAIKASGHDALYMVDAVASLGCMPFDMDAWGVDVAMAGSQKGLMTPPGLSFVAAGRRARAAHKRADLRTPYWDWTARESKIHYMKYAGTPPEHLMFGLDRAFEMIRAEGPENIFRR